MLVRELIVYDVGRRFVKAAEHYARLLQRELRARRLRNHAPLPRAAHQQRRELHGVHLNLERLHRLPYMVVPQAEAAAPLDVEFHPVLELRRLYVRPPALSARRRSSRGRRAQPPPNARSPRG